MYSISFVSLKATGNSTINNAVTLVYVVIEIHFHFLDTPYMSHLGYYNERMCLQVNWTQFESQSTFPVATAKPPSAATGSTSHHRPRWTLICRPVLPCCEGTAPRQRQALAQPSLPTPSRKPVCPVRPDSLVRLACTPAAPEGIEREGSITWLRWLHEIPP